MMQLEPGMIARSVQVLATYFLEVLQCYEDFPDNLVLRIGNNFSAGCVICPSQGATGSIKRLRYFLPTGG